MVVHIYINGVKKAHSSNWPQVPSRGDLITWEQSVPLHDFGERFRVVRVIWVIHDTPEAHVYLKGAWT